ncbi:MAG: hypothetical protein USCGTAYLOR_02455 [Chromatiales bacterium USCg_Taylor]|nr:MAG: hypothetical protein USCGTAYLOR_02455 [Chromatiales bacterium USCg_Taylor]
MTLITGIFGMNVAGHPGLEDKSAFLWVTLIMVAAGRFRRGPRYVRQDIQVTLAPSVSRRVIPFAATVPSPRRSAFHGSSRGLLASAFRLPWLVVSHVIDPSLEAVVLTFMPPDGESSKPRTIRRNTLAALLPTPFREAVPQDGQTVFIQL